MEGFSCFILCLYIVYVAGKVTINVEPTEVEVEDKKNVLIWCGLDMLGPKTDVVYSIMIKRRGKTCAVLFRGDTFEIQDKSLTLLNFTFRAPIAFLQLKLRNITCADSAEYSCSIAIRRSYRNLQLGPVATSLKVKVNDTTCADEPEEIVHAFPSHDIESTTTSEIYRDKIPFFKVERNSKCTRTYIIGAVIFIIATIFVVFLLFFVAARCEMLTWKKTDTGGNDTKSDRKKKRHKIIVRTFWTFKCLKRTFKKLHQEDEQDETLNPKYQTEIHTCNDFV